MHLKIKPLNETAREVYSDHGHFHEGDAGLDLYVLEDITIEPGETKAIKLGIACEPEDGRAYFLMPRSSISKTPLRLANSVGIIDSGYRGNLGAKFDVNTQQSGWESEEYHRLLQICSGTLKPFRVIIVDSVEQLNKYGDTERGEGGFGSTGK